jgi:pimeloyl-ACP methyl ester carboxylesterase
MKLLLLGLMLASLAACASPQRKAGDPIFHARVETPAGAGGLRHYEGTGAPVLLLSSPGLSGRVFDVPGYGGLAPYLQHKGFDVWVLDWNPLERDADWNTMVRFTGDTIRTLAEEHPGLSILAHGLGGVAVIASAPHAKVARYVFVAVPGVLKEPLDPVRSFAARSWSGPHSLIEGIAAKTGASASRSLYGDLLWNYGMAPLGAEQAAALFEPVSPAFLKDLAAAIQAGGWGATFDHGLRSITQPVTVYVGQTDGVAPPWQTYATFKNAGSAKKQYRFFSRANGERREYGHLSVLLGQDAAREIYPFFTDGLEY